jgi:methyl-accepting chemotaxis protein
MKEIICDKCGKKYKVDETKIKGDSARLKCKGCDNVLIVTKAPDSSAAPVKSDSSYEQTVSLAASEELEKKKEEALKAAGKKQEQEDDSTYEKTITLATAEQIEKKKEEVLRSAAGSKVRFGLSPKIIIVMLLISLMPLTLYWGFTYQESNRLIQTDNEVLMAQTVLGLSGQVDEWIDKNILILRTAARLRDIGTMDRLKQEPILKAINQEYPWMYLVFTVGVNGMNVARNDDKPLTDYSDRNYYKDIMNGKELSWQVLIGKTSKKPAVVLAVPVRAADNSVIGVMAAAMNIDDISKTVAAWKKGKTGFAFLVDEKGKVISHQVPEYVLEQKDLNNHPLISSIRKKGKEVSLNFKNDKGKPSYGYAKSNKYEWVTAIQQEEEEAFGQVRKNQLFALSIFGFTVFIVSIIAWLSARTIVMPIKQLTVAAERMSMGDLEGQIQIKSKDEIGLLAQALNRMQTSLKMAMERMRKKK